jgi:hypothetical protein
MRRPGNRNFTKPGAIGPIVFSPSSFERVVTALKISPEEYRNSPKLKEWVRRNKDQKYVPTDLLKAFGFLVEVHYADHKPARGDPHAK